MYKYNIILVFVFYKAVFRNGFIFIGTDYYLHKTLFFTLAFLLSAGVFFYLALGFEWQKNDCW